MLQEAQPQTIGLIHQITSRDGSLTKDSKMVNCYPEKTESGAAAVKRPGLSLAFPAPAAPGRGQGFVLVGNNLVTFVGGTAYIGTISQGPVATPAANTDQPFYAVDTLSNALGFQGAVVKQSRALWIATTSGVGQTVTFSGTSDANYPAITVPGIVSLDFTAYVLDSAGNIRGSALNNANSWPVGNSLQLDPQLGNPLAIHRHLNYVIGFADRGLQFFYDAANPTGSPLSPVPSGSYHIGCADGFSVAEVDDVTYFIGKSGNTKGRGVYSLAGTQIEEVGNPHINKILNAAFMPANIEQCVLRGYGLKSGGHSFYVLNLFNAGITLVYDITYQHWHVWTSVVGGVEQGFVGSCSSISALAAGSDRTGYIQDYSTGAVYAISEAVYQDNGNSINVLIRTNPYDWGTLRRKFFAGLYLLADTVAATLSVSYSDDDYQTFSTPRNVDLSTAKKMLLRIGSSRRRSFDFKHTANTPLKLYGAEVPFEPGA